MSGALQEQNPRPQAAVAPGKPTSLDEAIFRFWTEFVTKQISAGRRDVGRMLEVALGFFFERSLQGSKIDLEKRNAVEHFIKVLQQEIAKAEGVLQATNLPGATGDTPLTEPYPGVQIFFRDTDLANATQISPLNAQLIRRHHIGEYLVGLNKQAAAADRLKQLLTDKLVANRKVVAQRLKDLSPQLYELGTRMVGLAPPMPSAVPVDDVIDPLPVAALANMPRTPMLQLIVDSGTGWLRHQLTMVAGGLVQVGPALAGVVPAVLRGTVRGIVGVGRGVRETSKAFVAHSRTVLEESRLAMEQARYEAQQRAAANAAAKVANVAAQQAILAAQAAAAPSTAQNPNVPVEEDERFREFAELANRWMQSKQDAK